MSNKTLAYSLLLGQIILIILAALIPVMQWFKQDLVFKATETHMWLQFILAVILAYGLSRYTTTADKTKKMRKAAGTRKEIKSKRIELLIFAIMVSIVFYSLFYLVPMRKYMAEPWEWLIYLLNSALSLLILIRLVSSHESMGLDFVKSKQKYAGAGALAGLGCFLFYYLQLN